MAIFCVPAWLTSRLVYCEMETPEEKGWRAEVTEMNSDVSVPLR